MPLTVQLVLTLAVAAFVLISAIMTGSFPLGLAGSINATERPKTFWSLVALVCGFLLLIGFVV